jgi:hypothetical protein
MIIESIDIRIKRVLNEHYGDFNTTLELDYENIIADRLLNEVTYDKKLEWATYNQVVLELKHNLNDYQLVSELQYRLSDLEHPKRVCMEVITNSKTVTPELQRLYEKIVTFND